MMFPLLLSYLFIFSCQMVLMSTHSPIITVRCNKLNLLSTRHKLSWVKLLSLWIRQSK